MIFRKCGDANAKQVSLEELQLKADVLSLHSIGQPTNRIKWSLAFIDGLEALWISIHESKT
jgi:hypothetical protein